MNEDNSRGIYDIKDKFEYSNKADKGLNENIIKQISEIKKEPQWVLDFRLKALKKFFEKENPLWGPNLSEVDINQIVTYIKPKANKEENWDKLPRIY